MKRRTFILSIIMVMIVSIIMIGCNTDNSTADTNRKQITSVDDLVGSRIGVQLGTIGDILASDIEGAEVQPFNKGADAIQALKQDKVDCIIIDEQPAIAFVNKNPELKILEEEFATEDYAMCISKENTELKQKVNDIIEKIEEDGTLQQIIDNYIGDDTKGTCPYVSPANVDRSNGTLVVATNAEFEPYEYMENGEVVGIDMEIAQAIADNLGMELKIENIAFDSIINAVTSGKADIGIAGMTVTEDRLKNIDFTIPYTTSTQVIVVYDKAITKNVGFIASIKNGIQNNFIDDNRWEYIVDGLLTTLKITFFAVIIGIVLGFLIAIIRSTCDRTNSFKFLNGLCKLYLTVIRGTPAMIQLLIIYYVIFASSDINKIVVAIVAFGLNSSAYIAEIVRSGIMSVDNGQFEAGRSLGFTYNQTMWNFILPQAFKNVLPALCNEFIVLLKETSIAGYIGIMDLTRGGDYIRSRTYDAFFPLFTVALVYLTIVVILTNLVGRLERRLKNDVKK